MAVNDLGATASVRKGCWEISSQCDKLLIAASQTGFKEHPNIFRDGAFHPLINYSVQEILKRKKIKDKYEYLIWWRGEKTSEATWEPRDNLIKFVKKLIDNYDKAHS